MKRSTQKLVAELEVLSKILLKSHKLVVLDAARRLKELQEAVDEFCRGRNCSMVTRVLPDAGLLFNMATNPALEAASNRPACRKRFSLCLDCDEHNGCGRYRQHRLKKDGAKS